MAEGNGQKVRYTREALAQSAREKLAKQQWPNARELQAFDELREREIMTEGLKRVPKRIFNKLTQRQSAELHRYADRLGIPVRDRFINLYDVLPWLFDFVRDNGRFIKQDGDGDEDDPALVGSASPNLERYRKAKAIKAERENLVLAGELLPRDVIRECHVMLASRLRRFGEALRKEYGPEAMESMLEVVDDCEREIDKILAENEAATDD